MTATSNGTARATATGGAEHPAQSRRRVEVVIVGAGDETLIEIGPALGDRYRTHSVDSVNDIAALAATSWVGLYDATTQTAGRGAFAQLELQYGRQPWIVLCADDDRPNWRDVLSRGSACAVIARGELGPDSLAAALATATQHLHAAPKVAAAPAAAKLPGAAIWIGGAALIAVLAAAAWWWGHSQRRVAAAPAAAEHRVAPSSGSALAPRAGPAAAVAATAAPASVEDLLSQARVAFRDPATQLPKADAPLQGTSALELYGAVLRQQPGNGEALDGVRRLESVARLRVQDELNAGDVDTAARLLAILQHAGLAPEELRALETAVAAARPKQLAAQARSAIASGDLPAARQLIDQLVALVGERPPVTQLRKDLDARALDATLALDAEQVHAAISAGTLLEPEGDNARTRLLAMQNLSRTSPQTLAAQRELLAALLRRARSAVDAKNLDLAAQTLLAAQDFGSKADLAETRAVLDAAVAARRAADAASAAAAKAAQANAAKAAKDAAAAVILAPKPLRALQVDFPPAALAQNIQGYVVVEFMLNPNGSATAASVVEASPRDTFDGAALAAIRRAKFATGDLADPKVAQRARMKINFRLAGAAAPAAATNTAPGAPAPAAASAPPAAAGAGSAPQAAPALLSPRPARPLQVNYPQAALQGNVKGYVVIEFMLNPDGTPSAATVVDSSPPNIFDHEALLAVKGARFVTTDLADPAKPQRARVKINFKPN